MWMLILVVFALVLAGAVTIFGGGIFTIILVPLLLVPAVAIASVVAIRYLTSDEAPTVPTSQPQPTGKPRGTTAGPGTANERVGQT
jgi:hypothetical protein